LTADDYGVHRCSKRSFLLKKVEKPMLRLYTALKQF
jgi:hypothetical protein